ncbi:glycosyltransferase family 4 protein [Lactococcus protaetiae]|uniref:Glycosyltransferase family 4 protein n=1 Tax=Lactococcus protaetiae TaxID=2592653 RepID=A0A514Z7C6_9LACT|nr:glycosyltransferase family 4 protein [Lactococcus protaetiae]QDK70476.1 glycosyltransferase family 4 protein [Lactococcus protaetiae]
MRKTIAIFSGFYLPFLGGIERYTYNIVQKFMDKGYNVIVVTTQHDFKLPSIEVSEHLKIYRMPIKNLWRKRYPFFFKNKKYHEMLNAIKKETIDYYIVNTRFQLPALLGARLAKEANKKALVIEHGTTYLTLNNPVLDRVLHKIERILVNKVKKNTDIFYGVSNEAAMWLETFGIEARGVLYNAVEKEDFEKYSYLIPSKKITISYSGRLQAKFKGVEMLLSAFVKLSKEYNNLELVIAGDGPIYQEMVRKYTQKNIKFLGHVSHEQVMKLNNQSDIFVLMSKIEGFSTSMLEAGMMKNVIITTNVGGAHELLLDDSYGFVIENSEEVLIETIKKLISNPESMKEIQEKVAARVLKRFTWERTVEEFEKAFVDLER